MKEKLDEIWKGLAGAGFTKEDDDTYSVESVSYNTVVMNGVMNREEVRNKMSVRYIGLGGGMDSDNVCDDDMMFFDIIQNGNHVLTVGVYDFEELMDIFKK
jgi:hypothetical protein